MKNKIITFLVSMGIPLNIFNTSNFCTGVCGNCKVNCMPGFIFLFFILFKLIVKKLKEIKNEKKTSI